MLDETKIAENWTAFREIVNTSFDGERKDSLNIMYDTLEDKMILAPASNKEHFHNAFPGGYVDHVLRVIDFSKQQTDLWKKNEVYIDFTDEELIFSAMHHDLGKIGDLDHERYLPNESQWHREKMGLIYQFNPKMHHMATADRSFFLLQHFGVKITQLEFIGIKCTDGLYDDANETYLFQSDAGRNMKTNLVYILHHADMMATKFEYWNWKNSNSQSYSPIKEKKITKKVSKERDKLFQELFK